MLELVSYENAILQAAIMFAVFVGLVIMLLLFMFGGKKKK